MAGKEEGQHFHVIVACAHRKTRPVPPELRLRRVTSIRTSTRLRDWIGRLTYETTTLTPAQDLYAGDHWKIARNLPTRSQPGRVILWICSAGYGLISGDAPVR